MNLLLVMLLSGLWHGAAWNFVVWGGVLGTALVVERLLGVASEGRSRLTAFSWFLVVQLAWIFSMSLFRSHDLEQGLAMLSNAAIGLQSLFLLDAPFDAAAEVVRLGWWLTLPICLWHGRCWLAEQTRVGPAGSAERSIYSGAMLAALLMLYHRGEQFIYFQF